MDAFAAGGVVAVTPDGVIPLPERGPRVLCEYIIPLAATSSLAVLREAATRG